jgi:hypothetical protein
MANSPRTLSRFTALAAALAVGALLPAAAAARGARVCSATASAQLGACRSEAKDDYATARAICLNRPDEERAACLAAARAEAKEAGEDCRDQREARRELCDQLGEERYDPDFDPAAFDSDFGAPTQPNPWFPLGIGHTWQYAGGDETIEVEVLDETKQIEGVTCIVVRDRALEGGQLVEDTDDWFALRMDGTVFYCGEISRNFELFPGDVPALPELVDTDGSWKAGRDGALPGTLFPGAPAVGQVYRQEWAPGDAEDAARVLSVSYSFGSDPELDASVPQALAELLCAAGDCVVTAEFTPIEPDALERKYYAPGIGLFLEVDVESGGTVQLVDCNFDARCAMLPLPTELP